MRGSWDEAQLADALRQRDQERRDHDAECAAACAGIDTAHLWPGAMGEMVGVLKSFACNCARRCEAFEWLPGDTGLCSHRKARAILAKLGKADKPACNHAGYNFAKHGRACHKCGAVLTDFGD